MTAAMSRSGGIRVTLIQWIHRPRDAQRSGFPIARRACRITMLGLFVLALTACAQSPEAQKQKALERGETYLRKGQYNEAIIEFRNALQVDPEFVPALHALGRAYEGRSWFFDAWRELTRAQSWPPTPCRSPVEPGQSASRVRRVGRSRRAGGAHPRPRAQELSGAHDSGRVAAGAGKGTGSGRASSRPYLPAAIPR